MKILEKAGINLLCTTILDVLPDRMVAPMRLNKSLRTRTTQYITTTLNERHGTLTKQELDLLTAQLKKKCPADLTPDAFIADWQASLDDLAQVGEPISQIMTTEIL